MLSPDGAEEYRCNCNYNVLSDKHNSGRTSRNLVRNNMHRHNRPKNNRAKNAFRFTKCMKFEGTDYDLITSVEYLNEKYGIRKSHYIEKFIKCIHKKIDHEVNKISDSYIDSLGPWVKIKFFLLLVTLSQKGGPEYWIEKDQDYEKKDHKYNNKVKTPKNEKKNAIFSLTEHIMRQNINHDFTESAYDENYVFSSIWANFMEGLINHYLEQVIVPHSEMKVCQQLYKPMMKIISLYNEYNELMEKSEHNGFLPSPDNGKSPLRSGKTVSETYEISDCVTQERLQKAQKLLWQARQDIPKTISKELTLLSEMYSTLSADEQDYELDEFVCCAEGYVELEYLPSLIDVLFQNCGSINFWKIMIVLEPFFYYIEDVGEEEEEEDEEEQKEVEEEQEEEQGGGRKDREQQEKYIEASQSDINNDGILGESGGGRNDELQSPKPDPRVIILEKICEVAARQKWI